MHSGDPRGPGVKVTARAELKTAKFEYIPQFKHRSTSRGWCLSTTSDLSLSDLSYANTEMTAKKPGPHRKNTNKN